MRRAFCLAAMLGLAACDQPTVVDDYPKESCADVDAAIPHFPGVKPSDRFETVEKLACLYGAVEMTQKDTCTVAMDAPTYYREEDERVYGLKDASSAQLIASWGFGHKISQDITSWQHAHRVDPTNGDRCLRAIQDVHGSFAALDEATRGLRRLGY